MAKKSDVLVTQLLKKVEEKKIAIKKIKNPNFRTNLSFPMEVFGSTSRVNLNVAGHELLISILVYLETMINNVYDVAKKNDIVYEENFYGFKLEDWSNDIVLKIKQKQAQRQVTELKEIERKLESLMSEDVKTNIELEKLSNLLND